MPARLPMALLLIPLLLCACRAADGMANPPAPTGASIVYVTPTPVPTLVPTIARFVPTATPDAAATADQPSADETADCDAQLQSVYARASDLCLMAPSGHFCSGGGAPSLQPGSESLAEAGDLAETDAIDSLHSPPLGPDGGGLVWMRLEADIRMDALLVGDVRIADHAGPGQAKWRSLTIESGSAGAGCDQAPAVGAFIAQGRYGQSANLVINGVSAAINGTLIVLTQGNTTQFLVIEGRASLVAFGRTTALHVGQQLNLIYAAGDFTAPQYIPGAPKLIERDLIKRLPVVLFDRPLPIPQSGYAQTQGGVNMRAAPDINSRLLFQVPAGETMGVLGISSDRRWLHIRFGNGETGWMSAELLVRNLGLIEDVYDQTPAPPQRYGAHARRAVVNVSAGGNLREAPDTAFRVKRTLPYGTEVKLLARSPYSPWAQVEAEGMVGWMALFTLETAAVIGSLPIDYDVPLPPRATATPSFSYGGGHAYPDPSAGY